MVEKFADNTCLKLTNLNSIKAPKDLELKMSGYKTYWVPLLFWPTVTSLPENSHKNKMSNFVHSMAQLNFHLYNIFYPDTVENNWNSNDSSKKLTKLNKKFKNNLRCL